jgi:tetratricopeptide (TPR) repeat protein
VKADSTFGLALRRMHLVLGWNPPTAGAYQPDAEYAIRSHLWNQGLSPRESLLIVAESLQYATGTQSDARGYVDDWFRFRATLEDAVRRYPEDPEAWYVLAEARNHSPRPIGQRLPTTFATFERVIALDPGFAPAYEHMVGLASQLGRPEVARRYAATYLSLDPTAHNAPDIRLASLLLDPATANGPEADRLIDTASRHAIFSAALEVLATWPDSGETAIRLLRRIGEPHRSAGGDAPWVLDSIMWPQLLAHALVFRGHLREALETNRRLLLDPGASEWSWFLDPFLSLSLLGALPDSIARAVFARGLDPAAYWGRNAVPRHLLGLPWWLAHRDTVSLARLVSRAGEVTDRAGQPSVVLRARLLGAGAIAYGALARGDSATATRLLETLPDTLCLADNFGKTCSHLNLTLGRLLAARGEYGRARDLLEDWRWTASSDPMFVLATLELGRIAERLGDTTKAAECYGFVMAAWHRPDRELLPYVAEAREGLARVRVE